MGLERNENKTKLMLLSRESTMLGEMPVGTLQVESVQYFKYLGSTLTIENVMEKELMEGIGAGNRCACGLSSVLNSRSIYRKTKLRTYNIVIRPKVQYGCVTWTLTKERMQNLEVFENGILRKILGVMYDEEEEHWKRRHNIQRQQLSGRSKIQDVVMSKRLLWARHCQNGREQNSEEKHEWKSW
ncbi:uncharacterized protein LOC143037344 [Oratosquilla oratoria]|uniref:uncharacterized protein LOC143037344 n=1 Tax=Oratosquilla oratoria TaxID=337810 RepID=UPI003F770EDF